MKCPNCSANLYQNTAGNQCCSNCGNAYKEPRCPEDVVTYKDELGFKPSGSLWTPIGFPFVLKGMAS